MESTAELPLSLNLMHYLKTPVLLTSVLMLATLAAIAADSTPSPSPKAPEPAASPGATPSPALPKIAYGSCHVDGPYVAMTFDDGPSGENTPRLLDMLKERNIKATFFMVGENAARYPKIVARIAAEGHEIGNHSWSHPLLSKMTDDGIRNELQKTQDAIVQASGYNPGLLRPPYGGFTGRQRRWANDIFGYKIIFWDVDPLDWKIRDSSHVESEILKQTKPGSIILSHDIHKTTVDAMPATLDALLAKGFKFVTVSQLVAMDHPAAGKGKPENSEPKPLPLAGPATSPSPSSPAPTPH